HEQNAVLGKANRAIARLAQRVALSFERTEHVGMIGADRLLVTGNPIRPGFAVAPAPADDGAAADGAFRLLILGGSQGARVFSDVVPAAIALLPATLRLRLHVTQQCRAEDLERAREAYRDTGIEPELAAFFPDIAERMGRAHL